MIAAPDPPQLRAVPSSESAPLEGEGLTLAYAALERVRAERGLERLTVAVDDPQFGRQLFTSPRADLPDAVEAGASWSMEPPGEPGADLELAVALCGVVLRASSVEESRVDTFDALELVLRQLEGVEAVAADPGQDVLRIRAQPGGAAPDVAREALALVKARVDRSIVVEVVSTDEADRLAPDLAPISWAATPPLELIAFREDAETGELEVHLRSGDVRTIGRAPSGEGPAAAAEAALAAWSDRPGAPSRSVAWVREVSAAPDGRCVFAVAIEGAGHVTVAHGIGTAASPVEAAVRATIDALSR